MIQRTNEEELDLFADLLEPVAKILADDAIRKGWKPGDPPLNLIRTAIKLHKREIIEILARIDDVPVEEYHVSALTLPIKVFKLLQIPDVQELFTSQGLKSAAVFSGSAMENIKGGAE